MEKLGLLDELAQSFKAILAADMKQNTYGVLRYAIKHEKHAFCKNLARVAMDILSGLRTMKQIQPVLFNIYFLCHPLRDELVKKFCELLKAQGKLPVEVFQTIVNLMNSWLGRRENERWIDRREPANFIKRLRAHLLA
jgi:hypothetical protein